MNKSALFMACLVFPFAASLMGSEINQNYRICRIVSMPEIDVSLLRQSIDFNADQSNVSELDGYSKVDNIAESRDADWSHVIGVARNVTLMQAKMIADSDPSITFFFRIKEPGVALSAKNDSCYLFNTGDTVFFSGDPWWNGVLKCADFYIRQPG